MTLGRQQPISPGPHWPGELIDVGSTRIFVRRAVGPPESDPAVLVHGLGGQATNWTDFMHAMGSRLDSWAPDLPGFGWSPPASDGNYSFAALTAAATAVVEAVVAAKQRPVHLFGNSLGGAVAVRLAAQRPDLVRSLIMTSPALPDLRPRRHTLGVPAIAMPGVGERVWRRLSAFPPEVQVQTMLELNYGDPSLVSTTRRDEAAAEYRRRMALPYAGESLSKTARGLLQTFAQRGAESLWKQAAGLRCPSLILYGGRDRLVNPKRARRVARTIPTCRVVMLPRVGHVAQMEAPDLVAHFVRDFLDQLPAS